MGLDIEVDFDDLGLAMDGLDVGAFSGAATIRICTDGEWLATEIRLDGCRKAKAGEASPNGWVWETVTILHSHPLFRPIADQLETGSHRDYVESRVISVLEEDGSRFLSARGALAVLADMRS